MLLMMLIKLKKALANSVTVSNDCTSLHIWLMRCFPDLFCYGHANLGRGVKILHTFIKCCRALFRNKDPCFRQSLVFINTFYQIVHDTQLMQIAGKDLRSPVMLDMILKWSHLTVADIVEAAEDEARGSELSNKTVSKIV
jgi:hypothetical protein